MYKILTVIAFVILTFNVKAQNSAVKFNSDKLDAFFARINDAQKGMGSISIFENGKEIYHNAYGYSNIKDSLHANSETKYRIGSISKTFTAVIIMQLIDENKLKLNTPLNKYYPTIPNAKDITVEQLLRHRSGVFNFTNTPGIMDWIESPKTKNELIELFAKNSSVFTPNEKNQYSNTNYVLLSFIAEDIEGKTFSQLLNERIVQPLQLSNTYYGGKINSANNEAYSYNKGGTWELFMETDMSIPVGAGAVISTAFDLNIFYSNLFISDLISKESLKEMMRFENNYGIGMFSRPFKGKDCYGHGGAIDGFQSDTRYFINEKIAISYVSNGVVLPLDSIINGALNIYFDYEYSLPNFSSTYQITSSELDKYQGNYKSETFPFALTISTKGSGLVALADGQPPLPLEAFELNKFQFEKAGIQMFFIPDDNKMIMTQGDNEYEFKRVIQ